MIQKLAENWGEKAAKIQKKWYQNRTTIDFDTDQNWSKNELNFNRRMKFLGSRDDSPAPASIQEASSHLPYPT